MLRKNRKFKDFDKNNIVLNFFYINNKMPLHCETPFGLKISKTSIYEGFYTRKIGFD
jgi:hypothetical protein